MKRIPAFKNVLTQKIKEQTKPYQPYAALEKRSIVFNWSFKAISRMATLTLFCFLSQTFGSILWANLLLPRQHHFHESGYVGLHIAPEFGEGHEVKQLRLTISVSERLYADQQQETLNNMDDLATKESPFSTKDVCSTLLTPNFFDGTKSILSLMPKLHAGISDIVDDSLKDLFLIATEAGDLSITSRGLARTNQNLYLSIMGNFTVYNLRAHGICVKARSLDIKGNNDITHLDYIKSDDNEDAVMTLQEEGHLQVQHMHLHKTTFNNQGTASITRMTGDQAVLNNYDVLESDLMGHFCTVSNKGMAATYTGKLTADVVTVHNENVMTLLAGSHVRGDTFFNAHDRAQFKTVDSQLLVQSLVNHGHLLLDKNSRMIATDYINKGRTEFQGIAFVQSLINKAETGHQTPVLTLKERVHVDTLTNAGELNVVAGLTYTKKFTNEKGAKACIQGLAYAPASEEITGAYDLENSGALDLTHVDQAYGPKRIQNTVEGTFMLHDNQGEWDRKAFYDINFKGTAFKRGLVIEHLRNEGLFQYWDGVYHIEDIHNKEGATFLMGHKDASYKNAHLLYNTISNQGIWESIGNLVLRNVTKTGKLRVNGDLTVYGSKDVNLSDVLKNDIQAKSITLKGHTLHNPKDQHLKLYWMEGDDQNQPPIAIPLTVDVKDFTNAGRLTAGALALTSDTFLQTNMGLIETKDDIRIDVKGNVDNKWGQIRSTAKTYVRSKEGDILVGDRGEPQDVVYKYKPSDYSEVTRRKRIFHPSNGGFIEGSTHLILEAAKTIDIGFGGIYLKGSRVSLTDKTPYLHLKAGLQILDEAGLIYSTRSILFETPKFHSYMAPQKLLEAFIVCTGKRSRADAQYAYATSAQPKIESGGFISFQGRTVRLTGTELKAVGSIKKVNESGEETVCTNANPNGLILEASVLVNRLYRVDNPCSYDELGRTYPTTLLSGADVEDITGGSFTINGLVAVLATNVTILPGKVTIQGAVGTLFGLSENNAVTNGITITDNTAPSRQFSGNVFHPTEDTLALMGTRQQPLISNGTTAPYQLSCLNQQSQQTPLTFVRPLLTSSFFQTQVLPVEALTFLTQNEQPIELPGGCSFSKAYSRACASNTSLHQARQLPTPFSLQDMEMFYDLSHSGLLHKTTAQNTFLDTMQTAFEFSQGTGYLDVSALSQFNKPFTVFAIVNHNDKRVIQPYTITPNEYYEERAKIVVSTILAKQSFCLKTCEDLSINQLMIKAKTIDIKGNTIDFNRFATFSEGETRFAAQSFLLDRAGHHQATTIRFLCGGPIVIGEDHDVYERHIDTKKHKEHTVIRTSVPTKIEADYAHFESLGGADITFVGTQIESPSEVVTGGRVHFKLGTNTYYSYRFDDDSNALWRDQTSSVQQDLTFSVCQFTHPMHIKNASQVIIEKVQKKARKGGFYRSLLLGILDEQEAAGSTSDPAFVQQLRFMSEKTPDKLEYILAKEVHTYQENCVSGPGVGLMAIVAVATAVLTNGLGSSLYASATGTQVGALSSTAVAASNAAMSSLCVQTSMGLMQNGGDPFKTLQTLTSKDTVKNIALSAATAGVCDLATGALGFSGTDLTFADNLQKHLAHASISTGIRAAAGEEIKDPIEAIARSATASAIGGWAAGQIGAAYADPHNPIDPASHKLYHAALGAATGSLMGGTGCVVSGAVGALVAELSTDIMGPSKPLEQMKQKEQALGRKLTRAEFHVLYPSVHKAYFEDVENTKKISKIMAGIAAAFAGHNIVVGAATGAVAVDNNFGFAAAFGVSALADTAFAAYLVEGLTLVGGAYLITEALDFIGVQAVDGGYQYHDRFYGSVSDALAAVMLDNPITQAAGSIYLVAKTLLDVVIDAPNHLTDLDLTRSASYDNSHQQKQTGDHQPQRQQPQQSSSASTGGSMPPPEDPDDEGKFKKNKLTEKQREQLKGKTLEGENPGNIAPGNRGFTNVDTEKLGGLEEAKKTFERLTGEKVPGHLNKQGDMHYKILPNGNRIQIRFEGDSGHPKIDITDQVQKILEKVSFK